MRRVALGLLLVLAACQLAGPPQLVRDAAGIFSAEARADAESRLRAVAAERGMWAFVVTDPEGDPPRMLDEPMREADAMGVRALAALFGPDRVVGAGFSRALVDGNGGSPTFAPPDVDELLAGGEADEALARIVDYLESWANSPPSADDPPRFPGIEGPSGAPVP